MTQGRDGLLLGSTLAVAAMALGSLTPAPVVAQDVDARWLPWVGCWEQMDAAAESSAETPMLCVRPAAQGVELLTVSGGEVQETRLLRADGVARRTSEEGCTGTESATFSADNSRLYESSELECGAQIARKSSRMWAMTSPSSWVDIRAVDVEGQGASWIDHYRLAPADRVEDAGMAGLEEGRRAAIESGRVAAASPITPDALVEAYRAVGAETVKAWIAERGEPIRLDAARLVQLADAGVPPDVIDVAVAVSYPDRFAVAQERPGAADRDGRYGRHIPVYVDPWSWGYPYSWYGGYYSRYGYYGLYGWGLYGGYPYYGYGPTVVVVRPSQPGEYGAYGGRMVRGRGYTQRATTPTTRSAHRPGASSTPSARAPSGSTRSASPRPSSSGSTKRTAKPRGGGHR